MIDSYLFAVYLIALKQLHVFLAFKPNVMKRSSLYIRTRRKRKADYKNTFTPLELKKRFTSNIHCLTTRNESKDFKKMHVEHFGKFIL